jgi:cytochrome c oxidase subunit II
VESQAEYNVWLKGQKAQYELAMAGQQTSPAAVPGASGDSTQQRQETPSSDSIANRTAIR